MYYIFFENRKNISDFPFSKENAHFKHKLKIWWMEGWKINLHVYKNKKIIR